MFGSGALNGKMMDRGLLKISLGVVFTISRPCGLGGGEGWLVRYTGNHIPAAKKTQSVNWYSNTDLTDKKARFTEAKISFWRNFGSTFF